MSHVSDDLELYAVGALPAQRASEVAEHLRGCAACRTAADDLMEVVASLAEAVPQREPPQDLKRRILSAAAEDTRPRRGILRLLRIRFDPRLAAMAAAIALLLGLDANQTLRLQGTEAELAEYRAMAAKFAGGGRTWYMAGVDQWRGMGGNLMQPGSGQPAVVLFHHLRPLGDGQSYTVWLIAADGKWVRGTSFRPDGRDLQMVAVGQELAGYERCAVTVESSTSGRREGPVVMESRIVPPDR